MPPSTIDLYVAIFRCPGEWRQWSLYLGEPENLRIQVVGQPGSFRYDLRRQHVEQDPLFIEKHFLCQIWRSDVQRVRDEAPRVWIEQSTRSSWNSQTWIIEALMTLERLGIIQPDQEYRQRHYTLDLKRDMIV